MNLPERLLESFGVKLIRRAWAKHADIILRRRSPDWRRRGTKANDSRY
jgi:hypothetical protein